MEATEFSFSGTARPSKIGLLFVKRQASTTAWGSNPGHSYPISISGPADRWTRIALKSFQLISFFVCSSLSVTFKLSLNFNKATKLCIATTTTRGCECIGFSDRIKDAACQFIDPYAPSSASQYGSTAVTIPMYSFEVSVSSWYTT